MSYLKQTALSALKYNLYSFYCLKVVLKRVFDTIFILKRSYLKLNQISLLVYVQCINILINFSFIFVI